jgi:hypothetical protein
MPDTNDKSDIPARTAKRPWAAPVLILETMPDTRITKGRAEFEITATTPPAHSGPSS